ncbi:related to monooxygenase [Phialocephala subalpina]|uniref:Related to monooxygenase n=1 Tax=Phialocephala subalpina TaxID=576137 RepID=A0A1L7X0V8_9HELO|nr:related to monooxygenase [Phialocephala subalpina]
MVIGADGNNSVVRKHLLPEAYKLNLSPVNLVDVARHFTPEQAAPIRAIDPLLFQGLHPEIANYLWYSIQLVERRGEGCHSEDSCGKVASMKRRVDGYSVPLRSIVMDIPDDLPFTTPLRLTDFPCVLWNNSNKQMTLTADSCHTMMMYHGEEANHGILDAALLVDQLKKVHEGSVPLKTAIASYEAEIRPRTHEIVLKSRQAALDAHD